MNSKLFSAIAPVIDGMYVPIQFVSEHFDISVSALTKTIERDPYLQSARTTCQSKELFGDLKPRICLSKDAFIRLIQIASPSLSDLQKQNEFVAFQRWTIQFLISGNVDRYRMLDTIKRLEYLRHKRSQLNREIKHLEFAIKEEVRTPGQLSLLLEEWDKNENTAQLTLLPSPQSPDQ